MPIEVRDAIFGLIELNPVEWRVIDTPAIQRLRDVQQLAMTHLVYPGARHSRFEHSVGACYIAGRLSERLELDSAAQVRLAALLHDVGHGPFSHVSEQVFEYFTGRKGIHESISAAIVRHDPAVREAVGDETGDWIANLLTERGHARQRSVERDIVAGPADIDKLDYLLRDSHYCGVEYGNYDIDKLIESARQTPFGPGSTCLAFHEDGIYALEGMLLARHHMHRQVYGHRTRIATDLMLQRAMILAVEEGLLPRDAFAPPENPEGDYVSDYLRWDDAEVVKTLLRAEPSPSTSIMQGLVDRRLLKRVLNLDGDELTGRFGQVLAGYVLTPSEEALEAELSEAEAGVAEAAETSQHWVQFYWESQRSPIAGSQTVRIGQSDILLVDDEGNTQSLNRLSEIFTEESLTSRVSVSLYLRRDSDSTDWDVSRVEQAALDGLRQIGEATAAV